MEKDNLIEKSLKLVNIQKFDDALKILDKIKYHKKFDIFDHLKK